MASGTLRNLETSAFVRTPPSVVLDILRNLLAVSDGAAALSLLDALDRLTNDITILDPTCGEGDFLHPLAHAPHARLFGVEISRERADIARDHLPTALIVTSAFEATRITPRSVGLVLTNPPYMVANGVRLEYSVIRDAGETLMPGGVMVAVVPARQWDGTMANHWCKHYEGIRCWKFRDNDSDTHEEAFAHYTQIVVVGVRRERPLESPDPIEKARLRGWRWRMPEHTDESPWAQGYAPDDLPMCPIIDPYIVSPAATLPEILALKADDAQLLKGLETSGAHLTPAWRTATEWQEQARVERPLMPPTGTAHLAADILTGLFDGEIVYGPDELPYVFTTYVTTEMVDVEVDEDARAKHVTRILQQQDKAVLGVLSLTSGEIRYEQGEAAFAFLTPWLPTLAAQVLARRDPIYQLDPEDWQVAVVAGIGVDKTLPGAAHAGLAVPQMHRAFAMYRGICDLKRVAIQGEPGTGKTRMGTALFAQMAYRYQHRDTLFRGQPQPAWMRRLRKAWKANPNTIGDAPNALPLMVATPKRVTPVWEEELTAAWPGVETLVIETHHDVRRWLQRCAISEAPAVVAIFPHSLTRPGRITWQPAVIERRKTVKIPDLDPPEALLPTLEPVYERGKSDGKVIAYRFTATGRLLEKDEAQSRFFCPDCGVLVEAEPRSLHKGGRDSADTDSAEAEAVGEDKLQPVTSITFFVKKQQRCRHCDAPLWTRAWTPATAAKYGAPSFAEWSRAVERLPSATTSEPAASKRAMPRVRLTKTDGGAYALGPAVPDSFSPYQYLLTFFAGCVANAIIDESHNARGRDTDIAQAIHQATRAAQTSIYASGTHYGGSINEFFFYWYRFDPTFWRRLGWGDVAKAIGQYGVVQEITKEYESDARKGSGTTDVRVSTVAAPGISARLLPHLLRSIAFIGVLDVGAFMPERVEIPVVVEMQDAELEQRVADARANLQVAQDELVSIQQEARELRDDTHATTAELAQAAHAEAEAAERVAHAQAAGQAAVAYRGARDLARHYHSIEGELERMAQKRSSAAMLAKGTLPRWWAALPCVEPAFEVTTTRRGDWGDVEGVETIFTAPVLAADHVYPLERKLIEIVTRERAEGRRVMVFYDQNDIRNTAQRLSWVLSEFSPWTLPNSVDAEDREAAIKAAVAAGRDVVIVSYRRVSEGLNLQCIDSVVWFEMAMNLFHLDQASRRAWRLGKRELVRLYYLVYAGTVAHKKLHKLGSQSGAATLFAGDTPDGELVRHAGADKTTLAKLSASMEAREEDLTAAFERRSKELSAALKKGREWIGVIDTLPERLAALRARSVASPTEVSLDEAIHETLVVETALPVAEAAPVEATVSAPMDLPCDAPSVPARRLVQFGDLAAIDSVLRRARKARRASAPAAANVGQDSMLASLFGEALTEPDKLTDRRAPANPSAPVQASLF